MSESITRSPQEEFHGKAVTGANHMNKEISQKEVDERFNEIVDELTPDTHESPISLPQPTESSAQPIDVKNKSRDEISESHPINRASSEGLKDIGKMFVELETLSLPEHSGDTANDADKLN